MDQNSPYNLSNLASLFNQYLETLTRLSKPSKRSYRSDVLHFTNWLKSHHHSEMIDNMSGITRNDFESYLEYLKNSNSPTLSTNRKLSALRLFFDYCLSFGVVSSNHARQVNNLQKTDANIINVFINDLGLNNNQKDDVDEFLKIVGLEIWP